MAQAIGPSGDIGLTFSAPGEAQGAATVHITSPTVFFPYGSAVLPQPVVLGVGQMATVAAGVGGARTPGHDDHRVATVHPHQAAHP